MINTPKELKAKIAEFKTEEEAFNYFKTAQINIDIAQWFYDNFNQEGTLTQKAAFHRLWLRCTDYFAYLASIEHILEDLQEKDAHQPKEQPFVVNGEMFFSLDDYNQAMIKRGIIVDEWAA